MSQSVPSRLYNALPKSRWPYYLTTAILSATIGSLIIYHFINNVDLDAFYDLGCDSIPSLEDLELCKRAATRAYSTLTSSSKAFCSELTNGKASCSLAENHDYLTFLLPEFGNSTAVRLGLASAMGSADSTCWVTGQGQYARNYGLLYAWNLFTSILLGTELVFLRYYSHDIYTKIKHDLSTQDNCDRVKTIAIYMVIAAATIGLAIFMWYVAAAVNLPREFKKSSYEACCIESNADNFAYDRCEETGKHYFDIVTGNCGFFTKSSTERTHDIQTKANLTDSFTIFGLNSALSAGASACLNESLLQDVAAFTATITSLSISLGFVMAVLPYVYLLFWSSDDSAASAPLLDPNPTSDNNNVPSVGDSSIVNLAPNNDDDQNFELANLQQGPSSSQPNSPSNSR